MKTLTRRTALTVIAAGTATGGLAPAATGPSGDAELLALKPEFDRLFEIWRAMMIEQSTHQHKFEKLVQAKTGMTLGQAYALDLGSPERETYHEARGALAQAGQDCLEHTDAWELVSDRFDELADDILYYDATTKEGLALQARAFISSYSQECDEESENGTYNFIASVCAFLGAVPARRRGAAMSATIIEFKPAADKSRPPLPADTVDLRLPNDYFLPRGMGPRQHQRLFMAIMNDDDDTRRAYARAMDAACAAQRALKAAVRREHEIIFAVMHRDFPEMERRIMAQMRKGRKGLRPMGALRTVEAAR